MRISKFFVFFQISTNLGVILKRQQIIINWSRSFLNFRYKGSLRLLLFASTVYSLEVRLSFFYTDFYCCQVAQTHEDYFNLLKTRKCILRFSRDTLYSSVADQAGIGLGGCHGPRAQRGPCYQRGPRTQMRKKYWGAGSNTCYKNH